MPMYDYLACTCGKEAGVRMTKVDERDTQLCECGQPLARDGVSVQGGFFMDHAYHPSASVRGQRIQGGDRKKGLCWV